jgi:hypothetical protein
LFSSKKWNRKSFTNPAANCASQSKIFDMDNRIIHQPTLLIIAAGMGSRYGGLKQIDPVGPNGENIIDYSMYDAV